MGLSYDNQPILAEFAERAGIDFPLLADSDSSSLDKLGLVNPEGSGKSKGVAFPGIIYLAPDGTIKEAFFEDSYVVRPSAESVLYSLVPGQDDSELPEGQDYSLRQTGESGIVGTSWELVVEFPLPDKAHLYAPGSSYQQLELVLEPNPYFDFGTPQYPESEVMSLEAIGESVGVYSDLVQIKVPVTIKKTDETAKTSSDIVTTIEGLLKYQICTDQTCYLPKEDEVTWKATIKPLDRTRAGEQYRHE